MFENLEERFNKKMNEIYNQHSARDLGSGVKGDEPYLEFKPNSPRRNETSQDTRLAPKGSIRRDAERMGRFLGSTRGLLFLAQQQFMQSAQPIAESRVLNPLFIIGNVQPYKRISRILASPSNFAPQGDITQMSPASFDVRVGSAGRLQRGTAKRALENVTGKNGNKGLLDLIPSNQIFSTIFSTFSLKDEGSTGVNQRPEFNVANKLYAVQLRNGFQKIQNPKTSLNNASAALRVGNVKAAYGSLKRAATDFVRGRTNGVTPAGLIPSESDMNNPNNYQYNGRRWFITDMENAERYLGGNRPVSEISSKFNNFSQLVKKNPLQNQVPKFFKDLGNEINSDINRIGRTLGITQKSFSVPSRNTSMTTTIRQSVESNTTVKNPVEESMLYDKLALQRRYLDDNARVSQIRQQLAEQKRESLNWILQKPTNRKKTGLDGGLKPGKELNADETPTTNTRFGTEKYLTDRLNSVAFIDELPDATEASNLTYNQLKEDQMGQDFIDVVFFDFVNKRSIPFRAFIYNLAENVQSSVAETPYIGRIERNITYSGVKRTVSFTLRIQAFDSEEMRNVWRKVNILTGLCFPSGYGEGGTGFMSPPYIKLTIGDIYRNQPAYLQNVTHTFDTKTSWETTRENQAPHGVDVTISLVLIEKGQMDYDGIFYPVTLPRNTKEVKFGDINKPKAAIPPRINPSTTNVPTNSNQIIT